MFGDYYIDLNTVSKIVTVDPKGTKIRETETTETDGGPTTSVVKEYDKQLEIDTTKYNMVNSLLDVFLNVDTSELDFGMGIDKALEKAPMGFRVAFNTLEAYGIIKELEN